MYRALLYLGLSLQGLIQIGQGLVHLTLHGIGHPPVAVGLGKIGGQFHRLGEVGDGPVILALFQIDHPPHVVSISIFGLEFQDLVEVGQGLVILAFLRISDAAIVKGSTELGIISIAWLKSAMARSL